ncbi:phytanoyl-CoA dioxygenase family protein [bacterium]|nr:phytanoyl-CoA dioxygenase family protein [bacterium]
MTSTAATAAPAGDVPPDQIQPFTESNDLLGNPDALLRRLRRDGYLFIRGLLPRAEVLTVRRQILEICQQAGWLRPGTDLQDGITDHEPLVEGEPEWQPVYQAVQKLESFHRLKLHRNVRQLMEDLFAEPGFCLPMTIGRIAFPRDNARATQPHQDWLYVQGSSETLSCWAPLGDVPAAVGGLKILAGSHQAGFLVPRQASGPGGNTVSIDPTLTWVASPYQAGDLLLFHQFTVHGARENVTPDRLRVSIDFRWTGVSHTVCENWMKPHFHWLGPQFSWDNLDRDWQDQDLRRYWERGPRMKTCPAEHRLYAKE